MAHKLITVMLIAVLASACMASGILPAPVDDVVVPSLKRNYDRTHPSVPTAAPAPYRAAPFYWAPVPYQPPSTL